MGTGAITGYIDVAQLALYAFWLFFFTLIFWLHRETKREGYPLDTHGKSGKKYVGFPNMPPPKTFVLPHNGGTRTLPRSEPEAERHLAIREGSPGYPVEPTGDPMADGVGPGSWAIRPSVPDLTHEGQPKIVPMRVATDYSVVEQDPDPRGKPVYGVDGEVGGTVVDIWVDRSEPQVRYFEVEVQGSGGQSAEQTAVGEGGLAPATAAARRVLLPFTFSRVSGKDGSVRVKSVMAKHFAGVPTTASPDQVTLQEEDRIVAYYGGGYLYAMPSRMEPLL